MSDIGHLKQKQLNEHVLAEESKAIFNDSEEGVNTVIRFSYCCHF